MADLLLVEDHVSLARIVARFLQGQDNLDIAAVVHSAEDALAQLPHLTVDLVLVDVNLPDMSGIDLVAMVKDRYPDLPCLMLSGHKENPYVRRALDAGAQGYVTKDNPLALLNAVQCVLKGGTYLSEDLPK